MTNHIPLSAINDRICVDAERQRCGQLRARLAKVAAAIDPSDTAALDLVRRMAADLEDALDALIEIAALYESSPDIRSWPAPRRPVEMTVDARIGEGGNLRPRLNQLLNESVQAAGLYRHSVTFLRFVAGFAADCDLLTAYLNPARRTRAEARWKRQIDPDAA